MALLLHCLLALVLLLGLAHTLRALPAAQPPPISGQRSSSVRGLLGSSMGESLVPTQLSSMATKRVRRASDHVITECITVASEEGQYFFKGDTGGEICGLYFVTDPDRRVHLSLDYLDVPCAHGGLVTLFDGWEMNQEFFPSETEHPLPLRERFTEWCSGAGASGPVMVPGGNAVTPSRGGKILQSPMMPKRSLMSSQNAAMIQFRAPQRSRGFALNVRFPKHPNPCNVLLEGTADVYTLKNYGKTVNCSLATLFPAKVTVLSLSVGMASTKRNLAALETGTIHKCEKRGMPDYVEVGGADGLDTRSLAVADSICGLDSRPGSTEETILCGVTAVRLVSSGGFENSVTVALRPAGEQDVAALICGL